MQRAKRIVNELLSAGPSLMPKGSVLVIYRGYPAFYKTTEEFVQTLRNRGFLTPDYFLESGGAFFIKTSSGDVRLYSRKLPVPATPDTEKTVMEQFGLDAKHNIAFSRGLGKFSDRRLFSQIFRKAEETPEPAQGATVGISYPKGTENGILIKTVDPKSPAAKAGLLPNDVIRAVGEYTNINNTLSPAASIKTPEHLQIVLKQLKPGTVLPLHVVRGGGMVEIPLVPEKATPEQITQGTEQKHSLPVQPNEPMPVYKTGNQPANVTTLT